MGFLLKYLRNIFLLVLLGAVIYYFFPDWVMGIIKLFGVFFGPVAIVLVLLAALPHKKTVV